MTGLEVLDIGRDRDSIKSSLYPTNDAKSRYVADDIIDDGGDRKGQPRLVLTAAPAEHWMQDESIGV